jgi:hypothetical protein|tara:strand:- start:929 stop:1120 length:192 start_codon:yes stop_codon:yes gene_type:complete
MLVAAADLVKLKQALLDLVGEVLVEVEMVVMALLEHMAQVAAVAEEESLPQQDTEVMVVQVLL